MVSFFLALTAVVLIGMFLTVRFKINSSLAPFFALSAITLFLCVFGMLDLLKPAAYLVFGFAVFSALYVFYFKRTELKENLRLIFSPGFVFFVLSSVTLYILLAVKNPYFVYWDEFSFWGIAAKSLSVKNELYTLFESSMINTSYPPALPLLSWLFQFFSAEFSEFTVYAAYAVFQMSVAAMVFSRIEWKNPLAIVAASFFGVFGVYLFWWGFEGAVFYCTAMSDCILGFAFAAPLLCYFSAREKNLSVFAEVLTGLLFLTFVKDMGFAFAFIAATVIFADMLLFKNYPTEKVFGKTNGFLKLVYPLSMYLVSVAGYLSWTLHFSVARGASRLAEPYEYSLFDMLSGKDEFFNAILKNMLDAIPVRQIVTFGPILDMLVVFLIVPIVVSLFTKSKRSILRTSLMSFLMLCGFAVYYLFQAYLYTAVFFHYSGASLVSFERYISSYAVAWFLLLVGVCFFDMTKPFFKKLGFIPAVAVCAFFTVSHLYYSPQAPKYYLFPSEKVRPFITESRSVFRDAYAEFGGLFREDDKIYFVCQDSPGSEWLEFNYEVFPTIVADGLGSGNFVPVGDTESEFSPSDGIIVFKTGVDRKAFTDYLREQGATLVFVYRTNDYFVEEFGGMFDDGLSEAVKNSGALYLVEDSGGELTLRYAADAAALERMRK